jgi:DNA-binding NtrC family response regulator
MTPQPAHRGKAADLIVEGLTFQEFKDRAEAAFIRKQLEASGWNVSKTADILQIQRSHLYSKMKKYGLERS